MRELIVDGEADSLDMSSLEYPRLSAGRLVREYNVI
jgi:hypothetical protein